VTNERLYWFVLAACWLCFFASHWDARVMAAIPIMIVGLALRCLLRPDPPEYSEYLKWRKQRRGR
jgi:hypothetical protein